jgi:hypothetical protein
MKYITVGYDLHTKGYNMCYHLQPYKVAGRTYYMYERRWQVKHYLFQYEHGLYKETTYSVVGIHYKVFK